MLFDGWLDGHIESFCHRQYWVLAPVLDFTTTKHRAFDERFPMPFEEVLDWSQAKGGANGLVLKVKIHEKYQRWAPLSKPHSFYAIKRFDKSQRDHFLNEKEALLRFSLPEDRHNNLIRLLFSYDIGSHMFMIFPGANWDLEGFWKYNKNNSASSEELIWLIHQCQGLADGLCKVHDYGGRHGDIKSRNLLFFADPQNPPGRLVVADFTLMRFHSPDSDVTKASKVDKTTTYRPPEADGLYSTVASPKFDIWTLGCVYLEFVTWHLLGGDAITEGSFQAEDGETYESFSTARQSDDDGLAHREDKFFNQFATNAAKVKASVETWIHCLRGHPHTSPALRGLLDLVEDHMLVVVPDDRCGMHMVKETLNIIFNQCGKHAEYAEPDSKRSTKGAVIAPRWTEKSKTYSRVAVGAMSTSPEPRDSGSKLDLETINQAFSDAIPFPQNQPTHQRVGVSNGLLSPAVMGSVGDIIREGHVKEAKLRRTMFPSSGYGAWRSRVGHEAAKLG
ncbi:CTD kinase subunit alpha [Colletotrichum aenigma]|uniref:CTD kinase subunit alpha n=1 Tax=Colletotrichum aenigma TaxID=1215731 RepID=UPI00187280A1|nr:CTD kinase subunit alpha [Colletotrichum aenigma]KAF5524209.1 CTD kinase subunit alpha [Colletotrichum aenigma]